MEKSKSSLLSSSMLCVRQMVLRVGFKFKLATARVRTPRPSRLLMALLAGCGVQAAFALPQGGQVASGGVTIGTPANNALNITQTTNQGVINWQSFNVASGEKVNFQQPGATSSTLNRVVGSDPSAIFGQINANGQVFLINNSGVLFAPGAQVNAAGLVASTLQLSDSDYLAGHYVLSGAGGSVSNQGVLKAGFVALAGSQVSNTGTIVANGGTAALAAGDRVTLNLIGSDLVSMSVDAPTAAAQVRAGGVVQADGGQVLISAKSADAMLGTVVNVDGIVQARSIGSRNGVISLDGGNAGVVAVSGTLDASGKAAGETGGTVKVGGANVGLFDHAVVDASGDAGGGVVRIGGDWHGAGADGDANASQVFMGRNAGIHANALGNGNGGNVVLWSDDHTQFFGGIDVRGGSAGGNGGAVETSSHAILQAGGKVDASAHAGSAGRWLLDPDEILITAGATTDISETANVWSNTNTTSTLDGADLSASLNSNTAVTVQTAGTGNGNITVDAQITATPASTGSLTLSAAGNISFTSNGSVIVSNPASKGLNLNLYAGMSGGTAGVNASTVTMDPAAFIDTGANGSITVAAKGAIHLSSITTAGILTVNSNGGAVSQETGAGAILDVAGAMVVNAGAASVTLNNPNNNLTGGLVVNNSGNNAVVVDNGATLSFGASSLGSGLFTVDTGGAGQITQSGAITQEANAAGASFTAGAHTINLGNAGNDFTGPVSLSNSNTRNVTLVNSGDLTLGTVSIGTGTNSITAGTAAGTTLTRGAALTFGTGGTPSLSVGGAAPDATVANYFLTGAGTSVSIKGVSNTVQDLTIVGATALPTLDVSGKLDITAGGDISQNAGTTLTVGDTTTIHGGAHAVNISKANNAFTGDVSVDNTGAHLVSIANNGDLSLGASNVGSGTLTVTTNGTGGIAQSGGIVQESGAGATSFAAGAHAINLGNGANDFTGTVSLSNSGANATTLRDANSLTLGTVSIGSGANTLAVGAATGSTLTRSSAITAGSAISLDIGGNTVDNTVRDYFTTGSASTVTLRKTATTAVDLTATGASVLPSLVVSGDLAVTAGGDLSQVAASTLNVAGTTTITGGAHAVDLSHTGNVFAGVLSVSNSGSNNVSVGSNSSLLLGTFSVGSGTLGLDASGTIAQNGATTITQAANAGAVTVTTEAAGGGSPIRLTNNNDFTGAVSLNNSGANNVAITDINALKLGASTVGTGTLDITSNGALSQTGTITQGASAGAVTINAQAGSISLGNGNTLTGTVNLANTGANSVSLNDTGALQLGTVNVGSGTLGLTSAGAINQSGTITQATGGGTVTINAGANAITLTQANDFKGAVSLGNSGANAVSVTDVNGLVLGTTAVGSGLLTVSAPGGISQTGDIAAGGSSSFNAGTGNVVLSRPGNTFAGPVTASGTSVDVAATGALQVNATLVGGTGDLALSATGALSGPTAVTTTGNISLSTGSTLTTAGALDGHDVSLTGTSVTLQNDVSSSGTLSLHATAGAITQSAGSVSAVAGTTLTADGGNAISLATGTNHLAGTVAVSGGAVNVSDADALTVNGTASSGLTVAGNGVTLGSGVTAVTGALSVNAGTGPIAQTGQVTVTGASTLNGGTVTLADPTNVFGGLVTATASSINVASNGNLDVTPNMTGGSGNLTLAANGPTATLTITGGAISTSGDVSLTAGGGLSTGGDISARNVSLGGGALTIGNHINATGTFNATSTSTITETGSGDIHAAGQATLDAGANAITLGAATNNFGAVTATGGAVTIVDADAMSVHLASATSANLTATAGVLGVDGTTSAGNLTVAGQGIVFGGGSTSVHGALAANSGAGTITQTGNVAVTGSTALDAGSAAITLANPGNDFGGAVTAHGGAIALTDLNALTAHVTGSGDAALVAGGLLTVDGSAANMTASGNGLVFGATTTSGLQANGGTGAITQTGALTLSNNLALTATGHDITLTNPANDLGPSAIAFAGANVALTSTGALSAGGAATGNLALNGTAVTLGASTVGGTLDVTGHGGIAGTNPVVVAGASTLDAGSAGITLSSTGNHFGGLVTATGGAIALADSGALSTHLAGATSATLNAGGAITVDGATTGNLAASGSSVSLGATTVGGTLTATASTGAIAQTGAVAVTGTSTLDATAGAVALANPANDFGGAVTASGSSVSLADANALAAHVNSSGNATLNAGGALSVDGAVGGSLGATSTGPITQSAVLTVGGPSVLDAGTAAITLATAGNDFAGAVTASGSTVALADANALVAHVTSSAGTTLSAGGALAVDGTVGGSLAATSSGAMTQSAALTVGGTSTLDAGTGAITLANTGNDFTGAVSATGGALSLTDTNALNVHLGGASSAILNAGGALAVDGNTSGGLTASGNGVVLGATTVGGNLAASSGTGSITQSGVLAVTGTSALDAGGHAITLANTANDFGGAVTASGGAVSMADANALTTHLTATSATLVAGTQLAVDGATTGTVTVTAASADVEQAGALKVSLNNVGSAVVKSGAALHVDGNSTGDLTATGSAVTLGGSTLVVGGNLAATSTAGNITQAGTLSVTGTSTLAAGSGNVTLADPANALGGAVTASGANVTLANASALTAHLAANGSATLTSASGLTVDGSAGALDLTGTSVAFGAAGTTVNGALTTSGGSVTQSGALAVSGLSTFNAGTGDILLTSPGTNLQGAITATGHTVSLSDAHAIDANVTATGDVTLASTGDVTAKGTFNGGLTVSGAKVTLDQGTLTTPMVIGGKLDVTSTGDTALTYVTANGAQVSAGGELLLNGTLKSTAGDVTLKADTIQGVSKRGAIDAAAGAAVTLDTTGGGNIGKATPTLGVLDADAIITLLGVSGQNVLNVKFSAGSSAWFRVSSQQQTALLRPQSSISSQTFFCDLATCVNVLGQTTSIADSVIANILTAASQDAADAAFGTENLDFAIRKGYVTTIGRVPPGIDEIAGDLGATPCDSRVTSPTAIAADKACSAGK